MDRKDATRRVRKMLRLSRGTSYDEERQVALDMALDLTEEYSLRPDEVFPPTPEEVESMLTRSVGPKSSHFDLESQGRV